MTTLRHLRLDNSHANWTTVWIDVAERSVNVLSADVFNELQQLLAGLHDADPARPIVFRSGKSKGFLAGADLKELAVITTQEESDALVRRGLKVLAFLEGLPQTTVAVIHGACLGGGLELALACSHRMALDDPATLLGLPEVRLGLIPGWGATFRLPRLIGVKTASDMMLTGRSLSAAESSRLGLVDGIAPSSQLDEALTALLRQPPRHPRLGDESADASASAICRLLAKFVREHTTAEESDLVPLFASLLLSEHCQRKLQEFLAPRQR